jgi:hypothetical protein
VVETSADNVGSIAEMAGGWGNHIMQDEISFMILDSAAVLIAVSLLSFLHPGIFFPQMAKNYSAKEESGDTTTAAPSTMSQEPKSAGSA